MEDMIFYSLPSSGPCKAMVEYKGKYYDVRSGWGEQEGWTNNHVATELTEEEWQSPAYDGEEMSDEEITESFDEDTLQGMVEAVRKAAGE